MYLPRYHFVNVKHASKLCRIWDRMLLLHLLQLLYVVGWNAEAMAVQTVPNNERKT